MRITGLLQRECFGVEHFSAWTKLISRAERQGLHDSLQPDSRGIYQPVTARGQRSAPFGARRAQSGVDRLQLSCHFGVVTDGEIELSKTIEGILYGLLIARRVLLGHVAEEGVELNQAICTPAEFLLTQRALRLGPEARKRLPGVRLLRKLPGSQDELLPR